MSAKSLTTLTLFLRIRKIWQYRFCLLICGPGGVFILKKGWKFRDTVTLNCCRMSCPWLLPVAIFRAICKKSQVFVVVVCSRITSWKKIALHALLFQCASFAALSWQSFLTFFFRRGQGLSQSMDCLKASFGSRQGLPQGKDCLQARIASRQGLSQGKFCLKARIVSRQGLPPCKVCLHARIASRQGLPPGKNCLQARIASKQGWPQG